MERLVVWLDGIRAQIGQLIGGGIAVYIVYSGTLLLQHGKSIEGFAEIGTAIAIGAVPFATKAVLQHREKERQLAAIADQQSRRR